MTKLSNCLRGKSSQPGPTQAGLARVAATRHPTFACRLIGTAGPETPAP